MNPLTRITNTDDAALHDHALSALAHSDMALAHAPSLTLDGPHRLEDVDAEWLENLLARDVPGAKLEQLVVDDAHDGMTSRKKLALHWNATGRNAGLVPAVFMKATPVIPYHRETLALLHAAEIEARFYQVIQPEVPELAPRAFYAKSYPGGRFLIVMEDLESLGLRPFWLKDECDVNHACAVATALAKLHARYYESSRLLDDLTWIRPRTKRFGWPWLRSSFTDARTRFLETEIGQALPNDIAALLRRWDRHDSAVYRHWDRLPPTVLHGDTHLGNTFAHQDGSAGLFDWQIMFRGPGVRDLAYFLLSALPNDLRASHERAIFDTYMEVLAQGGVSPDKEEMWNEYCLFALDAWDANIKTIIKATYGHATEGLLRTKEAIVGALIDNDVAGRLDTLISKSGG